MSGIVHKESPASDGFLPLLNSRDVVERPDNRFFFNSPGIGSIGFRVGRIFSGEPFIFEK
jgi:hypothetical protein